MRKALMDLDALERDYPVITEEDQVIFPVHDDVDPGDLIGTGAVIRVLERDLSPRKKRPRSYKELIGLPSELMELLPSSFDLIGDIAIMKLPPELMAYRNEIGEALRDFNKNIRTVTLDRGVTGEFRVRDLEVMAGDDDLETTHVENNLRFKLDPTRVYFSPRLATERMRIAEIVEDEMVLDMFSGVGPFSLNIASRGKAKKIVGIDLNPDSIRYFNLNITLNSLEERIETHLGDARDISQTLGPFDRIIMNLPHSSLDFLDVALGSMEAGRIHIYRILEKDRFMEDIHKMMAIAQGFGRSIEITGMREVHNYSPDSSMMVFDVNVLS